jgi:hypothetical protein
VSVRSNGSSDSIVTELRVETFGFDSRQGRRSSVVACVCRSMWVHSGPGFVVYRRYSCKRENWPFCKYDIFLHYASAWVFFEGVSRFVKCFCFLHEVGSFQLAWTTEKRHCPTIHQRRAWKPPNNRFTVAHQHQKRVDSFISNAWWLRMCGVYLHSPITSSCCLPPGLASKNFASRPQSVFFFSWNSEQMAVISLYSIKWSVFITETDCVYCAVRTGPFSIIEIGLSLWKVYYFKKWKVLPYL